MTKETPAALAGAVGAQKKTQIPEERIADFFHANNKKTLRFSLIPALPKNGRRVSQ